MSIGTACHFGHLCLILYNCFHDFIHVYCPRAVTDSPQGKSFDVNRNVLSLRPIVASLRKMSLKTDFIQLFMMLYMYIAPGQGQRAPRGQILMSKKGLITLPICCKFKKNLSEV